MRIIDKRKDYYDCMMTYGINKDVIYVRDEKDYSLITDYPELFKVVNPFIDDNLSKRKIGIDIHNKSIQINLLTVLFCGKIYRCLVIKIASKDEFFPLVNKDNITTHYCYNTNEALEILKSINVVINESKAKSFLNVYYSENGSDKYIKYISKYNIVVGIYYNEFTTRYYFNKPNTILRTNAILKDFKFMKVVGVYDAYQEIYRYIDGILPKKENMIVKISDSVMLCKKGFDPVYSFRKPKKSK